MIVYISSNLNVDINYLLNETNLNTAILYFNQIDNNKKEKWEQVRLMCYYSVLPNLNEGTTIKKAVPLFYDEEEENILPPEMSKERLKELQDKFNFNINNNG